MPSKPSGLPRSSKRAVKTPRKIRVCPFCKKPTLRAADSISGWMTAEVFRCDNCGYRGPIFIEVDPDEFARSQRESSADEEQEK